MKDNIIIAIDGPSGVGKGTLAKAVAVHFSLPYLDTGLLYRAVGKKMLDGGLSLHSDQIIMNAQHLKEADWQRQDLRTSQIDQAASQVAAIPKVRAALLDVQRNFAKQKGGVMDGRDIGTVIFPAADFKFFLTASSYVRAERRWLQYANDQNHLNEAQKKAQIIKIQSEIEKRDRMDSSREVAPLRPAEDAILIDTDHLSAEELLKKVIKIVHCRYK